MSKLEIGKGAIAALDAESAEILAEGDGMQWIKHRFLWIIKAI
jgi:hypothetical protein